MCGSDQKYKNCCMKITNDMTAYDGNAEVVKLSEDVQNLINQHIEAEKAKEEGREPSENKGVTSYG